MFRDASVFAPVIPKLLDNSEIVVVVHRFFNIPSLAPETLPRNSLKLAQILMVITC